MIRIDVDRLYSHLRWVRMLCLVGAAVAWAGCHDAQSRDDQLGATGITIPLILEQGGVTYRLNGVFDVSGPDSFTIDTDDDPDATAIDLDVTPGVYNVTLRDGWSLEVRTGASFVRVDAVLLSPNPAVVVVREGSASRLVFRFDLGDGADDGVDGALQIAFEVARDESPMSGEPEEVNCSALVSSAVYSGTLGNASGTESTTVSTTFRETGPSTYEATATIAGFGANVCGVNANIPTLARTFAVAASQGNTLARGEFRVTASGQTATVRISARAVQSTEQPCVEATVEIDPDLDVCGTNLYSGTLCTSEALACAEPGLPGEGEVFEVPISQVERFTDFNFTSSVGVRGDLACGVHAFGESCYYIASASCPDGSRRDRCEVRSPGAHGQCTLGNWASPGNAQDASRRVVLTVGPSEGTVCTIGCYCRED